MFEEIFEEYEDKGREKFKRLCDQRRVEWKPNPNLSEHYDGEVLWNGKTFLVEIKDRNTKFKKFPTVIFENYKNDTLKEAVDERGANGAFYVCFYDDEAFVFNIYDEEIETLKPQKVKCNKYTAFGDDKVLKWVLLLPKGLSHKYTVE